MSYEEIKKTRHAPLHEPPITGYEMSSLQTWVHMQNPLLSIDPSVLLTYKFQTSNYRYKI